MKKLLLLIPLMCLFSCETEEENTNNCLLYGNWNLDYAIGVFDYGIEEDGFFCFCGYIEDSCTNSIDACVTFDFSENGSFFSQRSEGSNVVSEESGTWTGDCSAGGSLVLTPDNTESVIQTIVIQTISNDHLLFDVIEEGVNYGTLSVTR